MVAASCYRIYAKKSLASWNHSLAGDFLLESLRLFGEMISILWEYENVYPFAEMCSYTLYNGEQKNEVSQTCIIITIHDFEVNAIVW